MSFTFKNIADSARIMLRDTQAQNWPDSVMLEIINDGVAIIRRFIEQANPDRFSADANISITSGSNGPFDLPSDFKREIAIYDDDKKRLDPTWEDRYTASITSGKPSEYWIKGHPAKIYFNYKADKAYTYVINYIPNVGRATALSTTVPLPDECYEVIKVWTEKIAGMIDEYATMDEDQKLSIITPILTRDMARRVNPIELEIEATW